MRPTRLHTRAIPARGADGLGCPSLIVRSVGRLEAQARQRIPAYEDDGRAANHRKSNQGGTPVYPRE